MLIDYLEICWTLCLLNQRNIVAETISIQLALIFLQQVQQCGLDNTCVQLPCKLRQCVKWLESGPNSYRLFFIKKLDGKDSYDQISRSQKNFIIDDICKMLLFRREKNVKIACKCGNQHLFSQLNCRHMCEKSNFHMD